MEVDDTGFFAVQLQADLFQLTIGLQEGLLGFFQGAAENQEVVGIADMIEPLSCDMLIQGVQIEVCQQGGDGRALGHATVARL